MIATAPLRDAGGEINISKEGAQIRAQMSHGRVDFSSGTIAAARIVADRSISLMRIAKFCHDRIPAFRGWRVAIFAAHHMMIIM
jgi:hypothetical protein